MSSLPARPLMIWRSSAAAELLPINGAFRIEVLPTLMVAQTLEFLREQSQSRQQASKFAQGFLIGMNYSKAEDSALYYWRSFLDSSELEQYDVRELYRLVGELEMLTDINFTIARILYLADIGVGPSLPLLIAERQPIARGVAFEIEERGEVSLSLQQDYAPVSDKAAMAQTYYSTGLALLAGEDQISGLIDAAFMQFYLAVETILESHAEDEAQKNGAKLFSALLSHEISAVVKHVYVARHRFFGHAHVKWRKGQLDKDAAFAIGKQCLVARWAARALIRLETGRDLVFREMRLYTGHVGSIAFSGRPDELSTTFAHPR